MKLHILFGQRKESYEGEFGPEVLTATDEFTLEENPDRWESELETTKRMNADEMQAMREIVVEVDGDKIRNLLLVTPKVKGEIKD